MVIAGGQDSDTTDTRADCCSAGKDSLDATLASSISLPFYFCLPYSTLSQCSPSCFKILFSRLLWRIMFVGKLNLRACPRWRPCSCRLTLCNIMAFRSPMTCSPRSRLPPPPPCLPPCLPLLPVPRLMCWAISLAVLRALLVPSSAMNQAQWVTTQTTTTQTSQSRWKRMVVVITELVSGHPGAHNHAEPLQSAAVRQHVPQQCVR